MSGSLIEQLVKICADHEARHPPVSYEETWRFLNSVVDRDIGHGPLSDIPGDHGRIFQAFRDAASGSRSASVLERMKVEWALV